MSIVRIDPEGPRAFARLREVFRRLLAGNVAPHEVRFVPQDAVADLFAEELDMEALAQDGETPRLTRPVLAMVRRVSHHRDEERLGLLYRALHRARRHPSLFDDAIDPDVVALRRLDAAVRREAHKTKAFVRFRKVGEGDDARFIAWHRPDHRVFPLVAPFFTRRFSSMVFTVMSPDAAFHHREGALTWGPGVPRREAPAADDLDGLWRTYYGAIFDPARVRLNAMRAEMPKKHWSTLPETVDLPSLVADAPRRVREMRARIAEMPSAERSIPPRASLPQITAALPTCRGCDLHGPATQVVPGEGPRDARIVIVGEQPGDVEDRSGRPFQGPAGQLLREHLREAGVDPASVFLTNAVKHFRFKGKKRLHDRPRAGEVRACSPWLRAELGAISPVVVVCLGQTAARSLLGGHTVARKLRGRFLETPFAKAALLTWHPAAALRARSQEERERIERELREHLELAREFVRRAA